MDILHLLDRLESVLTSGSHLPLSGKTLVDEHECLDIIDQLRVAIPDEVKQAKRLQADRDRILEDAESQAARVVSHAQEQASQIIEQHEITRAADAKARRILEEAQLDAEERLEESDRYALGSLTNLEKQLSELQAVVRNGIRALSKDRRREEVQEG